jgi:CheY-like chemotaxis protein
MSVFRIMIVEDDELTASKMEMQIDKLGHELFKWVKNSELAILALEQQQPDLILMDINIEGEYDGIELTDMIHQQWNIPIVFVSSLQDNYTFKRIKRTNPIAFIQKPFSAIQLQRTIELAVEQLQTTQERPYDISNAIAQQKQEYIFIKKR